MKRKWSELNVEKFFQDLDLNNLMVGFEDLAQYMDGFYERITFNLGNQISLKEKSVSKVNSHPWFDNTLRDQKRKLEERESGINTDKIINGWHSNKKDHDIIKC